MHVCILSCICIIVQSLNTFTVKGIKTNIGMKGTPSPQRFTGRDVICHMSLCVCHVKSGLPWIQETRADPIQPADTEPGPTWERGPASGPDEARLCSISAMGVDTHRGESGHSRRLTAPSQHLWSHQVLSRVHVPSRVRWHTGPWRRPRGVWKGCTHCTC